MLSFPKQIILKIKVSYSLIYSVNKILRVYYMSGTVLGAGGTAVRKTVCFMEKQMI